MSSSRGTVLLFLFLFMFCFDSMPAEESEIGVIGQKILLLHSYHAGFKWTDDITKGVQDVLGDNVNLFIEYMDTKHQYSPKYVQVLTRLLDYKFSQHNFQIIITSDNNAFNFLINEGKKFCGYTPIIFCGLNYPEEMLNEAGPQVTGIVEKVNFTDNAHLISKLHPNAEELVFITDDTPTGKRLIEEFNNEKTKFPSKLEKITVWYDLTMIELLSRLRRLPDSAVVLFSIFFRDAENTFYDWKQGTTLITEAAPVPVYGLWDFHLGQGIIGGNLVSGYNQGLAAGKLAKKVLTGTRVSKIPVQTNSHNIYAFDYKMLSQFGINEKLLPEDSTIINRPYSVVRENRKLFIGIFAVIIFLTVLVISLIVNVIMRHRVEKALKRAQNYIVSIINSMPSIIVGVDPDGRITNWNLKAEEEAHISTEEAAGQRFDKIFPRFAAQMEFISKAIQQQKTDHIVKTDSSQHPDTRYEEIVVYPLISEETEGAVIRVDDKTEQRKFEEMMIQNEKMLSVGGLAAGMAHEINNPLSAMVQNAQVALQRLSAENSANLKAAEKTGVSLKNLQAYIQEREIPEQLSMIREAGKRAKEIVINMLNFAHRGDAGRSSHDLKTLLDRTVELASIEFNLKKNKDFKKIYIKKEYEHDIPVVPCEAGKIRQVLLNILRNGAAAMYEKGETLREKYTPQFTFRLSREGDMARIEIEDNGPGIPEKIKSRIFEPFFTTKAVGEGTGLGLSIAYFIINEEHNGTMEVQSNEGEGTTFIIKLPFQ